MIKLDQLENYATNTIHDDPLVAGAVLGMGAAISLLVGYFVVAFILGLVFGKPAAPKPKRD